MSYGRFAVIIFIALSGFSLGLGLARSGWPFKSIATYAHRWPGASAALLGRVRIQSACDLVRARPARLDRAQREVCRRVRLALKDAFAAAGPTGRSGRSPSKL